MTTREVCRWGAAALLPLAALALRLALDPRVSAATPPVTLLVAIALVAWFYGFGPTLVASSIAIPASAWLADTPIGTWPPDVELVLRVASFAAVAGVVLQARRRFVVPPVAGAPSASSIISHELRAPLQAMRSWLDVLGATTDDASAQRAQGALRAAVDRQARLVEDLVEHARIEKGHLEIRSELVDVRDVVQTCVESMWPAAKEEGIEVVAERAPEPAWVHGDVQRLEQVVTVLLSNAIRQSEHGGRVEVRVELDREVHVLVEDEGVGIAPDRLGEIFEAFRQVHDERRAEGLGLGLWIAQRLVHAHGGSVVARSPGPGLGATFDVALPRAPTAPNR